MPIESYWRPQVWQSPLPRQWRTVKEAIIEIDRRDVMTKTSPTSHQVLTARLADAKVPAA